MWMSRVQKICGRQLPNMNMDVEKTYFVRFLYGEQEFVTKAIKGIKDPVWSQTFLVEPNEHCKIRWELWDVKGPREYEMIGRAVITSKDFAEYLGAECKIPLDDSLGKPLKHENGKRSCLVVQMDASDVKVSKREKKSKSDGRKHREKHRIQKREKIPKIREERGTDEVVRRRKRSNSKVAKERELINRGSNKVQSDLRFELERVQEKNKNLMMHLTRQRKDIQRENEKLKHFTSENTQLKKKIDNMDRTKQTLERINGLNFEIDGARRRKRSASNVFWVEEVVKGFPSNKRRKSHQALQRLQDHSSKLATQLEIVMQETQKLEQKLERVDGLNCDIAGSASETQSELGMEKVERQPKRSISKVVAEENSVKGESMHVPKQLRLAFQRIESENSKLKRQLRDAKRKNQELESKQKQRNRSDPNILKVEGLENRERNQPSNGHEYWLDDSQNHSQDTHVSDPIVDLESVMSEMLSINSPNDGVVDTEERKPIKSYRSDPYPPVTIAEDTEASDRENVNQNLQTRLAYKDLEFHDREPDREIIKQPLDKLRDDDMDFSGRSSIRRDSYASDWAKFKQENLRLLSGDDVAFSDEHDDDVDMGKVGKRKRGSHHHHNLQLLDDDDLDFQDESDREIINQASHKLRDEDLDFSLRSRDRRASYISDWEKFKEESPGLFNDHDLESPVGESPSADSEFSTSDDTRIRSPESLNDVLRLLADNDLEFENIRDDGEDTHYADGSVILESVIQEMLTLDEKSDGGEDSMKKLPPLTNEFELKQSQALDQVARQNSANGKDREKQILELVEALNYDNDRNFRVQRVKKLIGKSLGHSQFSTLTRARPLRFGDNEASRQKQKENVKEMLKGLTDNGLDDPQKGDKWLILFL